MKLKIVEMGSDVEIDIQRHRSVMPEPATIDMVHGQRFVSIILPKSAVYGASGWLVTEAIEEQWEKILVCDADAVYWAWRHIRTGLIFR